VYAVIETGGKQYRVEEGTLLEHERISGLKADDEVVFDRVLLIVNDGNVRVGTPHLEGVTVTGRVCEEKRGDKVIVYKYKSKKGYRRKRGHRQTVMKTQITEIEG